MDEMWRCAVRFERGLLRAGALALALNAGGCGSDVADEGTESAPGARPLAATLRELFDGKGGELVGPAGTPFAGLRLKIPAGALAQPTEITISEGDVGEPLPVSAVRVGRSFSLEPTGLTLTAPAELTLPFDASAVAARSAAPKDVRLWVLDGQEWGQKLQQESTADKVTVRLERLVRGITPGLPATPGGY